MNYSHSVVSARIGAVRDGAANQPCWINVLYGGYFHAEREVMLEYLVRFVVGGLAVSGFAALADMLRPKTFAGLFGAAPSIALATLAITLSMDGSAFAAVEGRSMILGAFALAIYSWIVCLLLKKLSISSLTGTVVALVAWFAVAFGAAFVLFRSS
jgi:hypothetical protein